LAIKLKTVAARIPQIGNMKNLQVVEAFYKFLLDSNLKDSHRINSLSTMILLAQWLGVRMFDQVRKIEVKEFLHTRRIDGQWQRIIKGPEGKWVSSYNLRLAICRRFFRWYYNRGKDEEEEWTTPDWFKIRNESSERAVLGPYTKNQIWTRDEVLSILKYVNHPRNKAIITMGWDMSARNHEITSLRIKDINFGVSNVYAEGEIPPDTKTGGGEITLAMSYPYARDWYNKHPLKSDDNAYFICSLKTHKQLQPQAIWDLIERLESRIRDRVNNGSLDEEERIKMEYLLKRKAFTPYCMFRHSSLTFNADHMPLSALNKHARWSQNSRQNARYIKAKIGQDARNKILETAGIKVPDNKKSQPAVHQCSNPDCNYVNAYESEICSKCSTPLTPMAFERIKQQQESKINLLVDQKMGGLIDKSNLERDNTVRVLQQELKSWEGIAEEMKGYVERQKWEEEKQKEMYETLDRLSPGWKEPYLQLGKHRPLTKEARKKVEEMLKWLRTHPDTDNAETIN
jgi:integrase/recombinase XerD